MADPPSLGSLPAELKGLIVREYNDDALLSLRLATVDDPYLATEAYKEFGNRFIKKKAHFVTVEGLQGLVDNTGHAILGRYVEEIVLYPFDLQPAWRPHIVVPVGTREVTEHAQRQLRYSSAVADLNSALLQIWPAWACEVFNLHAEDKSVSLLARAFGNIRERAAHIAFSVFSPGCLRFAGPVTSLEGIYGSRTIIRKLDRT